MDEGHLDDRYQFQPLPVRIWRRRHQLRVPLDFARMVYQSCVQGSWFNTTDPLDFRVRACWGIANGHAHVRMGWVHTMEEVMDEFEDEDEFEPEKVSKETEVLLLKAAFIRLADLIAFGLHDENRLEYKIRKECFEMLEKNGIDTCVGYFQDGRDFLREWTDDRHPSEDKK